MSSFSIVSKTIFALLISSLLLSCVGKKKYLAEVGQRTVSEQKVQSLETQLKTLNDQYASLKTTNANQQTKLNEQTQSLADLNEQLNLMKVENAKLQTEKIKIEKELSDLSNQALTQTQKLDAALQSKIAELNRKQAVIDELQAAVTQRDMAMKNILSRIESAIEQYSADELSVELRNGKVYIAMSDKLLFQSGSASVDKRGKEALGRLASVLAKDPSIKIMVEGHTDNVPIKSGGSYKDNWDLSVIRATSVLRILTKEHNINPLQITASGKGDTTPKAPNDTADGRALNRRTEIIIEPRLDEIYQILEARS